MYIKYLTHASLFLKSKEATFLTDPFLFLDPLLKSFMCHYPDPQIAKKNFGRIDFVHCSHDHDDHCHRETLLQLKDQIDTLLLPAGKKKLLGKIEKMGFQKMILLDDEQTIGLTSDLKVTSFHDSNGFDTALMVEMDGITILHQNDARLDPATFHRMAKRFKVDYAFFPHTSFQDLYPFLLPRSQAELKKLSEEREKQGIDYLIQCIQIIKPQYLIPYAYSVIYYNKDQWWINGMGRTIPTMFCEQVLAKLPEQKCLIVEPGKIIDVKTPGSTKPRRVARVGAPHRAQVVTSTVGVSRDRTRHHNREGFDWGKNVGEYLEKIKTFVNKNKKRFSPPDFMEPSDVEILFFSFFQKRLTQPFAEELGNQVVAFHVQGNKNQKTYYLDTDEKSFSEISDKFPFLEITMPAHVLKEFIRGVYDPFMILYSYRVSFKLNIFLGMDPASEVAFYCGVIISIFDPGYYD